MEGVGWKIARRQASPITWGPTQNVYRRDEYSVTTKTRGDQRSCGLLALKASRNESPEPSCGFPVVIDPLGHQFWDASTVHSEEAQKESGNIALKTTTSGDKYLT
ncbi:hypothetical protein AGOR_G00081300 [Albula goreensis]|uniref:Uncharacterized protein n=1 Tax=Albula goreensis TaxID=1534307 RepID=A0A8T3DIX3_9TELE|nr:hypothetical protein AGOR_G00081300 [Albula goreensis]